MPVQDGTFGTHFEFTPQGTTTNDFVNLRPARGDLLSGGIEHA